MAIRILIADDHTLFREMLRQMFSSKGDTYDVIGEASDGQETLNRVTRYHPDLLLLDYRMPGVKRLSSFCREVTLRSPKTRKLLLTGYREEGIAIEASIGGVQGYVLKGAQISDLLAAISTVVAGGIWADTHLPKHVIRTFISYSRKWDPRLGKLTGQELKILSLIAAGTRTGQIGARLHISVKTVKNHLTHIYSKLNASNRSEAIGRLLAVKKKRQKR